MIRGDRHVAAAVAVAAVGTRSDAVSIIAAAAGVVAVGGGYFELDQVITLASTVKAHRQLTQRSIVAIDKVSWALRSMIPRLATSPHSHRSGLHTVLQSLFQTQAGRGESGHDGRIHPGRVDDHVSQYPPPKDDSVRLRERYHVQFCAANCCCWKRCAWGPRCERACAFGTGPPGPALPAPGGIPPIIGPA